MTLLGRTSAKGLRPLRGLCDEGVLPRRSCLLAAALPSSLPPPDEPPPTPQLVTPSVISGGTTGAPATPKAEWAMEAMAALPAVPIEPSPAAVLLGCEYECSAGHRSLHEEERGAQTPRQRGSSGANSHAKRGEGSSSAANPSPASSQRPGAFRRPLPLLSELLGAPTPLVRSCPCEGCGERAQLQRLYVRTPDAKRGTSTPRLVLRPRIRLEPLSAKAAADIAADASAAPETAPANGHSSKEPRRRQGGRQGRGKEGWRQQQRGRRRQATCWQRRGRRERLELPIIMRCGVVASGPARLPAASARLRLAQRLSPCDARGRQ